MRGHELEQVRRVALALPGVTERLSHGAPCFFVGRRPFCYFHDVYIDTDGYDRVDWVEIAAVLEDAFRTIAPRTLIAELDPR